MSSISAKENNLVLLQTAHALTSNGTSSRSANVRVLFDTGSQRSYVTESLVKCLNLKPLRKERLQLNTFGESGFKGKSCDLVQIHFSIFNYLFLLTKSSELRTVS